MHTDRSITGTSPPPPGVEWLELACIVIAPPGVLEFICIEELLLEELLLDDLERF